jgi:predicted Zn-dependent protease
VCEPYSGFSLLDCYIFNNIRGVAVEAGVTRFAPSDFKNRKKVAHSDFNLGVDQTLAMKAESFNFTGEGITAQKFNIIQNGTLTEPICNLQSAKQLGVQPRALGSLSAAQIQAQSFEEFVSSNPKFILLLTLMGVHTQNEVVGNYSLPVPSALYFEDGKVVGAVNCVVTGDFFAKLQDPQTGFVQLAAYQKPSLTFNTDVTVK